MMLDDLITQLQAKRAITGNVRVAIAVATHGQSIAGKPAMATFNDIYPPQMEQRDNHSLIVMVVDRAFAVVRPDESIDSL